MITRENARGGQPVVKKNGRWLASSFDPVREAQAWARRAAIGVANTDTVFVLGIGSGYHVAELVKLLGPQAVVVVENDRAVVEAACAICPEIRSDMVFIEKDYRLLVENESFCDRIASVVRIAKYGPSFQMNEDYFRSVESLLLGRDHLSFLLQLKARPEMWAQLDSVKIEEFAASNTEGCIGIKTLQRLFHAGRGSSRERRIWHVLEELVA